MAPCEQERPCDFLGETSRRGFLKRVAALALTRSVVAKAGENRVNLENGSVLAYVGTYSSPLGPEGTKGNGQGIHLFQMNPATGVLSQRQVFPSDSNPAW